MAEALNLKEIDVAIKSRNKGYKSRGYRSTENVKFNNISPEVFYSSQWPVKELPFLLYKGVVAVYTVVILLCSVRGFEHALSPRRAWPVWLTNWSYFLLTAYSICSFVIVLYNYVTKYKCTKQSIMKNPPAYIKITWAFYTMAMPLSYLVTVVFFVALYPRKNIDFLPAGDVHTHLMNSVLSTVEILVGALPIRMLHIVYPILLGVVYSIFSVAYWLYDPVGNVIYPGVLDWNRPGKTLGILAFMNFVMAPLIQLTQYALFKARIKVYAKLFHNNFGED